MSVVSEQLDYQIKTVSHPTYQYSQITQQSGGTSINITTNGGDESIFEIPPKVANFSRSKLCYTSTPGSAGTSKFNWMYVDGLTDIKQIQFYTRQGVFLADIQDLHIYTNMVGRRSFKLTDVETWDKAIGGSGYFEGLRVNNNHLLNDPIAIRPDNTPANSINEPSYVMVGTGGANATPVLKRQIPLGRIVDSIFGLDKDLYFSDTTYIRIIWNPSTVILFKTGSATDPTAATVEPTAGSVVVTNLKLYLAIELNNSIIQELQSKAVSGSLNVQIPYVYSTRINMTGQSQNLQVRFNTAHGKKIKKIIWAPYIGTQSLNAVYDHNNLADAKIKEFYTMVNQVRTSQFNYDTSAGTDWMEKSDLIVGSCIRSSNEYYYNFVHVEDFTQGSKYFIGMDTSTFDDGLIIDGDIKYDIVGVDCVDQYHNHYVYSVVLRDINVSPAGLTIR